MRWADIPGLPGCQINEAGDVRRDGKPKSSFVARVGYKAASFSFGNVATQHYVHRLVLRSFVGEPPHGHEALHINGDRLDNRLCNLRWGTRKENVADSIRHGTATTGARNGAAKLRTSDIGWIEDMHRLGFAPSEIAPHFSVVPQTIRRVLTNQTYQQP